MFVGLAANFLSMVRIAVQELLGGILGFLTVIDTGMAAARVPTIARRLVSGGTIAPVRQILMMRVWTLWSVFAGRMASVKQK